MADWIKRGGCLPPDRDLARELCNVTYTYYNGKFRLEEKDFIKKRIGKSPDKADALALTFALPEMPAQNDPIFERMQVDRPKVKYDYDPLEEH